MDGAWLCFRRRLEDWEAYERPGYQTLAADPDSKVDFGKLIELAGEARKIRERLFTLDYRNLTRAAYPVQAESMRSILELIEEHASPVASRSLSIPGPCPP